MGNEEILAPNNLAELVRDKVKMALVDIVPQEQWDRVIKAEWDSFFKERTVPGQYGRSAEKKPSLFTEMVHEAIRKQLHKKIQEQVETETAGMWPGNTPEHDGPLVAEIVKECAPHIFQAFARDVMMNVVQNVRTALASNQGMY
jgi:hypothetical protein